LTRRKQICRCLFKNAEFFGIFSWNYEVKAKWTWKARNGKISSLDMPSMPQKLSLPSHLAVKQTPPCTQRREHQKPGRSSEKKPAMKTL